MKIAILSSGFLPVIDGVTVSAFSRLQKLSEWGHQVLFFCPEYRALENLYPNWRDYTGNILPGVQVINLDSTSFMGVDFERNPSRRSYPQVLQELKRFQPDIIHVDEPERLFLGFWRRPGVRYAHNSGIPCVSYFRTNFIEYIEDFFSLHPLALQFFQFAVKVLICYTYNAYDMTLVSSKVTFEKIRKLGIKNAVYADLHGFDASKFSPELRQEQFFQRQYGLSGVDQRVKLIFLGRLTADKGWDFTLRSFEKLAQVSGLDQMAFIVVGDGWMQQEIAERLGVLTPHVHLMGRVPPDQVPALLANSDIHITTSEKETRGATVIEAFASGIPVIAPRAGGVVENIQDGVNGFLFTPQDSPDFLKKLQRLLTDPQRRNAMGRKGRDGVAQSSWDQKVQTLVHLWQSQMDQKAVSKGH